VDQPAVTVSSAERVKVSAKPRSELCGQTLAGASCPLVTLA